MRGKTLNLAAPLRRFGLFTQLQYSNYWEKASVPKTMYSSTQYETVSDCVVMYHVF